MIVDKDCGFVNTTAANPLAINTTSGKLPVEISGFDERPDEDTEVTVCTLSATAAAGVGTDAFEIARTSACRVMKFEKRPAGDTVAYVATVRGKNNGAILILR